ILTTRLPPSVTNSQGKAATTPFGAAAIGAASGTAGGSWHESGERRSHGNLSDERSRLGVDHVDRHIRAIGEVVGLGPRVDETDVERVQLAIRRVRGGAGDRDRLEQPDRRLTLLFVSSAGAGEAAAEQERGNDHDENEREGDRVSAHHGTTSALKHQLL